MENKVKVFSNLNNKVLMAAILIVLTALITLFLHHINMPAAFLIGSIIAGIIAAVLFNGAIQVPSLIFYSAQSVLGCMIAGIFTSSVLISIFDNLGIVLFSVFSILVFGLLLGWILAARKILPGSTAIWGSWPGGATTLVILSEAYGADMRLVAFMQYMRVVVVAVTASLVTMFLGLDNNIQTIPLLDYFFDSVNTKDFLCTLALAFICIVAAKFFRFTAGPLLLAMIAGAVLINIGIMNIALPQWLLVITYVLIGWSIGLRFTREIVIYALKALPAVLGSIMVLMILCMALSAFLVSKSGIDPLTAYLAASPGGADSIAIIAASGGVDMAFVMSVQVMRFAVILLIGPPIATFTTKRMKKKQEKLENK